MPAWVEPMLATLHDEPFDDPDWIFERKLDGERVLAFKDGSRVRLLTRNRKDVTTTYPEIAAALSEQGLADLVVDGEVVAFEGHRTSFARLQQRMQLQAPTEALRARVAVFYYVFDVMYLLGHDVTGLPLRLRKRVLRDAVRFAQPLRFSTHRNRTGRAYLQEACARGWEGLIAKDAHAAYGGGRSRRWLKLKCVHEQEFVIGGFTDPEGSRSGFGALLVGYHDGGELVYAGKVGTGYDHATLRSLRERMDRLLTDRAPFTEGRDIPRRKVHWIRPELVAQIGFTEWTGDGKLRHPRFLGLRRDKDPSEVVRERPG